MGRLLILKRRRVCREYRLLLRNTRLYRRNRRCEAPISALVRVRRIVHWRGFDFHIPTALIRVGVIGGMPARAADRRLLRISLVVVNIVWAPRLYWYLLVNYG